MNQYNYAFYAGIALWAIETIAFGFHATAISGLEHVLDTVSFAMLVYGAIGSWVTTIKTSIVVHGNVSINPVELTE